MTEGKIWGWVLCALVLALVWMVVVGCEPRLPPIAPADVPPGACQAAQERLVELGCEEATTPGGIPFGEACEVAAEDGRSWCPAAISMVRSCAQVESAAAGERGDC